MGRIIGHRFRFSRRLKGGGVISSLEAMIFWSKVDPERDSEKMNRGFGLLDADIEPWWI